MLRLELMTETSRRHMMCRQDQGAGKQPHALGWVAHREGQSGLLLRLCLNAPAASKASRDRCNLRVLHCPEDRKFATIRVPVGRAAAAVLQRVGGQHSQQGQVQHNIALVSCEHN